MRVLTPGAIEAACRIADAGVQERAAVREAVELELREVRYEAERARLQDRPRRAREQIRAQERACQRSQGRLAALPERVPVKAVMDEEDIVKLAPEAKHLTDTIKMVAYRAETTLIRCLAPHYARTDDEGRALIREMLSSSVDIIPDAQRLRIRLHFLANPRSNQALAHVCAILNALELPYPGTSLTLVYEAPGVE